MKINADTLRTARQANRVTTRSAAVAADVSTTTIERLERTGDATHLTLGALDRLATTVGLTIHELLEPAEPAEPAAAIAEPPPRRSRNDDIERLGQALHHHGQAASDHALADALDVSLPHLDGLLTELDHRLRAAGLKILRTDGRSRLTAPIDRTLNRTIRATERSHATRAQIDVGDARVLYSALRGATEKRLRSAGNGEIRIGKLINAGLVVTSGKQNRPVALAPEVLFSIDPPPPPPQQTSSTEHGPAAVPELVPSD